MHTQDTHKVIVLVGPTAIGKTEVANTINELLESVIISADSRQVYQEMTIGTAKPSVSEIASNNIKLVDHISVVDEYSAGRFVEEATTLLQTEIDKGKTAIVCGGTGLYIKSLFHGIDTFPKVDTQVVIDLDVELENNGISVLAEELKQKDPDYYEVVDKENHRRIVRALSVIRSSGKPYSSFLDKSNDNIPFQPVYIILDEERETIYNRINKRVDKMFERGLLDEVESLIEYKDLRALQTVGYTEVFRYLGGSLSLAECKSEIKKNTRRYAKRQMTWNRNQVEGKYFRRDDVHSILEYVRSGLDKTL